MSDISTGHIYIITCTQNPNIFYIGSTFNELRHRWKGHKDKFKAYMNGKIKKSCSIYKYFKTYGIENFNINLIKSYKVIRTHNKDCKHLMMYEQLWMNKFKKCCNEQKAFNPLYYDKKLIHEQQKKYRTENIEKVKERERAYRESNREKVNEQKRAQYEKNKQKINEHRKAKYEKNKTHIIEKQKAYNEANREKINEQRRAYKEKNREKISEQKRAWREANREKINEQQKAYREANREKVNEQQRALYHRNKNK